MLDTQIIICGRGGQGVLFLTRLLMRRQFHWGAMSFHPKLMEWLCEAVPVASHIRIGAYESPLIAFGDADILLAVNEYEAPLNMHLLKRTPRFILAPLHESRTVFRRKK